MVEIDRIRSLFDKKRVVIFGVGNVQRSDDAAGSLVAQKLIKQGIEGVIDGADVPENFTGDVKAQSPQVILLVDAVDFGGKAGDVAIFKADHLSHDRFSSHRPSLGLVANYLAGETNAEVFLLGIQPQNTELGSTLSYAVAETIETLVRLITDL